MKEQLEKASEEHTEIMFFYDVRMQGDCYRTIDEVERSIVGIPLKTGKLKELKRNVTACVKSLG